MEAYLSILERLFHVKRAFVVQDMDGRLFPMASEEHEYFMPGFYDVGGMTGLDRDSMDAVCIIMIHDEDVLFARS